MDSSALMRAKFHREDQIVRRLLEKWVSGCNPAVVKDWKTGEILGLCDADSEVGDNPFIFRG